MFIYLCLLKTFILTTILKIQNCALYDYFISNLTILLNINKTPIINYVLAMCPTIFVQYKKFE